MDITHIPRTVKHRRDVSRMISSVAASYCRHQELQVRMRLCVIDELLNLDMQPPHGESYCWDSITLSLRAFRIAIDGTEMPAGKPGSSSIVEPVDIAAEPG